MSHTAVQLPQPRPKARLGCLGSLALYFVLGIVAFILIRAVFAPWSFFLGGTFHVFPIWQGWGRMHSKTAGDYALYVYMYPSPGGRGYPSVTGTATLCTPRGQRFSMHLGGGMNNKHVGLNTDGQEMHLYMNTWQGWSAQFTTDRRPRLDLRGRWQNPNLVMDDHGTLSRAFLPDGTLYTGPEHNQPAAREDIPLTLTPGSRSEFESACAAIKH
ncbi:MAG: hypothetical protein LAN63_16340 [Acidobacteriia bacterium]|nr:hypothetical protein [Terriglobia bacterium]